MLPSQMLADLVTSSNESVYAMQNGDFVAAEEVIREILCSIRQFLTASTLPPPASGQANGSYSNTSIANLGSGGNDGNGDQDENDHSGLTHHPTHDAASVATESAFSVSGGHGNPHRSQVHHARHDHSTNSRDAPTALPDVLLQGAPVSIPSRRTRQSLIMYTYARWVPNASLVVDAVTREHFLWLATIVIYNLALTYHLHAAQSQTLCSETTRLLTAQSLYKHAYALIATFPPQMRMQDLPRVLGIWMNLADIYDELGDSWNAWLCWQQFNHHLLLPDQTPFQHEQTIQEGLRVIVWATALFYRDRSAPAA